MLQPGGPDQVPPELMDAKTDAEGFPIYPDFKPSEVPERKALFDFVPPRRVLKYPPYDPGWRIEEPWPGKERGRPNPAWSEEQQKQWEEFVGSHKINNRAHWFFLIFTAIFVFGVLILIIREMDKRSKWYARITRNIKQAVYPSAKGYEDDDFLDQPEQPMRPKYDFSGKPPRPRN